MPIVKNPEVKFWEYVQKGTQEDCWLWTRSKLPGGGYGRLRWKGQCTYAHRVAYELTIGAIPPNRVVMHTCDNPACCNPAHLKLGTQLENIADRQAKNRQAKGAGIKVKTKLTPDQVNRIREMFATGQYTIAELTKVFECGWTNIQSIVTNKTWKHLLKEGA